MKPLISYISRVGFFAQCLGIVALLGAQIPLEAADFTVTTPGAQFAFNINGTNSPTLHLVRGRTYTFAINTTAGFHPFHIQSPGVMNNDITTGTMTYTVPATATNYLYYCTIHGLSMQGSIMTVDQPPPPLPIRIVGLSVNTNIVLRSTGTNTFTVMPEFKTNVTSTNWFALTVQTNRYASGTNETICGRPDGSPIFIRIKAVEK